jgi:hypothetical protein
MTDIWYSVAMLDPTTIVGAKEIAQLLRVPPNTVHQWVKRGELPAAEGSAGGAPAWHWSTIENWAREKGRLPGLREAVMDLLLDRPAPTTPLAETLMEQGVARSVGQVWRSVNDLHQDGFVAIGMRNVWSLSELGRTVAEARRAGTYWTHPLLEGGPFPADVQMRVRRVSGGREAEVKAPNGAPVVHAEGVLVASFHAPEGFETWDRWFDATTPASGELVAEGDAQA